MDVESESSYGSRGVCGRRRFAPDSVDLNRECLFLKLSEARKHSGSPCVMRKISFSTLGIDTRALMGAIALLGILGIYRFYDYWTTGFYVSDEFGYYYDAVHGAIYSDRWFFGWVNILLFKTLGITTPDAFSYLLPFYILFWTGLTFVIVYKLLNLLEFDKATIALTLASSFVLISFVLLALGFLTEPVGLCMAMCGIYFMARYMKSSSVRGSLIFPLLSACFFGFAAGTREPYNSLLIGGIMIVLVLGLAKRREGSVTGRLSPNALVVIPVLLFTVATLFFLFVTTRAFAQQVAPISTSLAQSIGSHTTAAGAPWYREYIVTNTLLIFFGGITLGWGPICVLIGLGGLVVLLQKSFRGKELTARFLLLTSVFALGSYFIVSFIYSSSPYYFSFQDYSTVIRFSDTALPAYFLSAPFFLSLLTRNRKRMLGLAVVCVGFLLVAVPVYQVYAASNINYTSQNPFQPGYHTDAALLRNYFAANDSNQTIELVGLPYGWTFTPGVQDLHAVTAYSIGPSSIAPEIGYGNFTAMKWPVFFLYVNEPSSAFPSDDQFLAQFFNSTAQSSTSAPSPFTVVGTQPVLHGSDFVLYRIQLDWP
jgi:hypothetical protein